MKSKYLLSLLCLAASGVLTAAQPDAAKILAGAPLRFEPAPSANSGSRFVARGARFHFEFRPDEAALRAGSRDIRLHFDGANSQAKISGTELQHSTTNQYIGNDPSKWRRGIPNYGRLQVPELYPGIDLAYYSNGGQLEYDLTVKSGADPRRIRFSLQGEDASLNQRGDLDSELIQKRPVAYQIAADGSRRVVDSRYRKNADGSYGFALGSYDHTRDVVIDPTLIVAQYFAGSYQDVAMAIGHDANGLIYVGGQTSSFDIALSGTPYQSAEAGGIDIFFAVINPALGPSSQVIYATYLGGTTDDDFGGMTVTPAGDVYITGQTESADFPMVNAPQTALAGSVGDFDAFVVWFSPAQALNYSTYFGGSLNDGGQGVAVDSSGKIWIVGDTQSTDLPMTTGFQDSLIGAQNMFVAGFNPSLTGSATEVYSIYIGGTLWDEAFGIAVASDGTLWIAGGTYSSDIWILGDPAVFQGKYGGDGDGYIAHINPTLGAKALLYATFLGGNGIDECTSLALDPNGNVIVSGYTLSTNFPVSGNAFQKTYGGNTDAFVTVLKPTGLSQLVYSTYFGGSGPDSAFDVKEDSNGILYVSGYTESAGLPATTNALQASYGDDVAAFGLKLDPTKSGAEGIDYFTYLGDSGLQIAYAVDFDKNGDMYLAGSTSTGILAQVGGPARNTVDGTVNMFVIGFPAASASPADTTASVSGKHLQHRHLPMVPHR
jgi:Beta-propeller repeat